MSVEVCASHAESMSRARKRLFWFVVVQGSFEERKVSGEGKNVSWKAGWGWSLDGGMGVSCERDIQGTFPGRDSAGAAVSSF